MEEKTATDQVDVARLRDELRQVRHELATVRAEQETWAERQAALEYAERQFVDMSERLDRYFAEIESAPVSTRRPRLLFRADVRPPSKREIADMARLRATPLFDGAWYLRENPFVVLSGMSPALHYLRRGGRNLRDPGPHFDAAGYVERAEGFSRRENPLLHYLDAHPAASNDPARRP